MSPTVKERRAVVITLTSCCMSIVQDATPEIRQRRFRCPLKLANGDIETVEVCLFEDWEGTLLTRVCLVKNNEWSSIEIPGNVHSCIKFSKVKIVYFQINYQRRKRYDRH
jgi:hypothetical protein